MKRVLVIRKNTPQGCVQAVYLVYYYLGKNSFKSIDIVMLYASNLRPASNKFIFVSMK